MSLELRNMEFYGTPSGDVMIKEEGKPVRVYEKKDREFTSAMIEYIREFYPAAFDALCKLYTKIDFDRNSYEYTMIHRFIRCNFREYDSVHDIDHLGVFRFENVKCPLRGECKYEKILCHPVFNTNLSDREQDVMRLLYNGLDIESVSDKLYISIETVRTHKRNSLKKLGLHSLPEFISYASKNNLFNE